MFVSLKQSKLVINMRFANCYSSTFTKMLLYLLSSFTAVRSCSGGDDGENHFHRPKKSFPSGSGPSWLGSCEADDGVDHSELMSGFRAGAPSSGPVQILNGYGHGDHSALSNHYRCHSFEMKSF